MQCCAVDVENAIMDLSRCIGLKFDGEIVRMNRVVGIG